MPRVDEIAKELNLSTDEVRTRLLAMGESVDGDSGDVSESATERLRAQLDTGDTAAKEADPTIAPPGSLATEEVHATPGSEPTQAIPSPAPPPTTTVKKSRPMRKVLRGIAELPILIIVAFVIAVLIKTFLVQAFYIPSGSMIPTLRVGDRVLVEKISYFVGDPAKGQVVVFAREVFGGGKKEDVPWYRDAQNYLRELLGLPTGKEEDYIKRIVAVGGDSIRYSGKPRKLFVNGERVEEDYINHGVDRVSDTLTTSDCKALDMPPAEGGCRVPAGKVFVMGDNRADSQDSRVIGPIDEDKIVGRAFLIIWPAEDFGTI
jgi:signal peptidase I